jgi:hypothetical protein
VADLSLILSETWQEQRKYEGNEKSDHRLSIMKNIDKQEKKIF